MTTQYNEINIEIEKTPNFAAATTAATAAVAKEKVAAPLTSVERALSSARTLIRVRARS